MLAHSRSFIHRSLVDVSLSAEELFTMKDLSCGQMGKELQEKPSRGVIIHKPSVRSSTTCVEERRPSVKKS